MTLTRSKLKKIIRKEIRESKTLLGMRNPTLLGIGKPSSSQPANADFSGDMSEVIIDKFNNQGFPKLGWVLDNELKDIVESEIQQNPEYNHTLKAIKKLSLERHNLIRYAGRGDYNDKTGKFRENSDLQKSYNDLGEEIQTKSNLLNSILFKNETINSKIKEFEKIKNGDQGAIENFINSLKNSTRHEGIGIKLNAIFELQDKGKIDSERVQRLVAELKKKKLVERKLLAKKLAKYSKETISKP